MRLYLGEELVQPGIVHSPGSLAYLAIELEPRGGYQTLILSHKQELHYLVLNIENGDLETGQIVVPFTVPYPQERIAKYTLNLYQQAAPIITIAETEIAPNYFEETSFVANHALTLVETVALMYNASKGGFYQVPVPQSRTRQPSSVIPPLSRQSYSRLPTIPPTLPRPTLPAPRSPPRLPPPRPTLPVPRSPSRSPPPRPTLPAPRSPSRQSAVIPPLRRGSLIRADSQLEEQQQKYCSCLIKSATKQTSECLRTGAGHCYNPYAICASSTHGSVHSCSGEYDFEQFDDQQLRAFVDLHRLAVPVDANRQEMLDIIRHKFV